jgi:hypothetical protein
MTDICPIAYIYPTATPTNNARVEFMYSILDGLPKARQKRLLVEAGMSDIGFLSVQETNEVMASLGLKGE